MCLPTSSRATCDARRPTICTTKVQTHTRESVTTGVLPQCDTHPTSTCVIVHSLPVLDHQYGATMALQPPVQTLESKHQTWLLLLKMVTCVWFWCSKLDKLDNSKKMHMSKGDCNTNTKKKTAMDVAIAMASTSGGKGGQEDDRVQARSPRTVATVQAWRKQQQVNSV